MLAMINALQRPAELLLSLWRTAEPHRLVRYTSASFTTLSVPTLVDSGPMRYSIGFVRIVQRRFKSEERRSSEYLSRQH